MGKNKDLTNNRFSFLTAIKIVPKPSYVKSKSRSNYWLCKCDCGNEKIVRSSELLQGATRSCGCHKKYEKSTRYKGVGRVSQSFYSKLIREAKRPPRNYEVTITKEFLWDMFIKQNGKCYYTGLDIELNPKDHATLKTTASVDRIDSEKGYIPDNVVWCHKDVNIMKSWYTLDYFLKLCTLIYNNKENIINKNLEESKQ